jgi:hypothetical protein
LFVYICAIASRYEITLAHQNVKLISCVFAPRFHFADRLEKMTENLCDRIAARYEITLAPGDDPSAAKSDKLKYNKVALKKQVSFKHFTPDVEFVCACFL